MKNKSENIIIYEHQSIWVNKGESKNRLTQEELLALQQLYGEKGLSYYSLIHKGVRFCEYVGVINIGRRTIEVLPKSDKGTGGKAQWKKLLIGMLRAVGIFKIQTPTSSDLQLKSNSILDLYIELFIQKVRYLLQRGLVKQYRKEEGNAYSLKGGIRFAKHIQQNLVHQERFYIRHTTYDQQHQFHQILYKALLLVQRINSNANIQSKLSVLLLDFPEQQDIKVSESLFKNLVFNRKFQHYKEAIEIARLLLMNYHPNVCRGQNHVLALLFDMNLLWEQFLYVSLAKGFRKNKTNYKVKKQVSRPFWNPPEGRRSYTRPDIIIHEGQGHLPCFVLDAKWKNLNGYRPSIVDLWQMYVYLKYFESKKVALIYPGETPLSVHGKYFQEGSLKVGNQICSLIAIPPNFDIAKWQEEIYTTTVEWMENDQLTK